MDVEVCIVIILPFPRADISHFCINEYLPDVQSQEYYSEVLLVLAPRRHQSSKEFNLMGSCALRVML